MRKLIPLLVFVVAGCTTNPGQNPDPVEVTGTITLGGKKVTHVNLNLQPIGKTGGQAIMAVTNGEFKGSAIPGKYTYFIAEGKNPAAFTAIPEKYYSGSLDREIEVKAGTPLMLTLD